MRVAFEIIIHQQGTDENGPTVGWKATVDRLQYGKWCKIGNRPLSDVVSAVAADFIETMQEPARLNGLELFENDYPLKPSENNALNELANRGFQVITF